MGAKLFMRALLVEDRARRAECDVDSRRDARIGFAKLGVVGGDAVV
jgi:hypothetical protein